MANTTATLSEVAVANMAVDVIDDYPLTSLDDDTKVGRFMARNFGPARDEILQRYPWHFAKKRALVAASATAPAFGWDYAYNFPDDCLKPLPLRTDGEWNGQPIPFEVESRQILTDKSGPLKLLYIRRVTAMSQWTPLAARVLANYLALLGAQNITGKSSYAEKASALLRDSLEIAKLADTLEFGSPESQYRYDILDVREGGLDAIGLEW